MSELEHDLYLIADEMRGMASVGRHFAGNVYEVERAHRIMELAARVAALAEGVAPDRLRAEFEQEPWQRFSPIIGIEALVRNPAGEVLFIRRRDNGSWVIPGGLAEIGRSFPETALRELWEEAGLRGRVDRLLGVFDGPRWGSRLKMHSVVMVFLVVCDEHAPVPGIEATEARFFAPSELPAPLHGSFAQRAPVVLRQLDMLDTYFDPASSVGVLLESAQRPGAENDE